MDTKEIQVQCALLKQEKTIGMRRAQAVRASTVEGSKISLQSSFVDDVDFYDGEGAGERTIDSVSDKDIESVSTAQGEEEKSQEIYNFAQEIEFAKADQLNELDIVEEEFEEGEEEALEEHEEIISHKSLEIEDPDTKIENHFIDVGSLTFGGIFGLGETLEHRVIMARTTVQCLLIPRFWLFEKNNNPAGIWDRRRFYLDSNIPSRETLFQNFLTTRKWQKFKHDLIQSNVDNSIKYNPTKVQDIPIICRIVEAIDD